MPDKARTRRPQQQDSPAQRQQPGQQQRQGQRRDDGGQGAGRIDEGQRERDDR